MAGHHRRTRRRPTTSLVVAGALAALGIALFGAAIAARQPAPPDVTGAPLSARADRAASSSDGRSGAKAVELPASDAVRVSIPALDVSSPLLELGLEADGALQAPEDGSRAGWYAHSASPGSRGASVIAGHVVWDGEPAVFFELATLAPGDRIDVARVDGRTAVFTVTAVEEYPKHAFPTERVYGPVDDAELRLITCGGEYDTANNNYLSNVVVYAHLADFEP